MPGGIGILGPFPIQLISYFNHRAFRVAENNKMHDCRINNYHGLCVSEASMFTTDVAVRNDDDDPQSRSCQVGQWI